MIRKITIAIAALLCVVFLYYLSLPAPDFPTPPPGSLQSKEPADVETPLRRAYFTNYTRSEVLEWYQKEFKGGYFLNYPPEEAQIIIRDQTRSTFLQEIVHPFRESLFINGFEPKLEKDAIFIEGQSWRQKIIVRYVPSSLPLRIFVFIGTVLSTYILIKECSLLIGDYKKRFRPTNR